MYIVEVDTHPIEVYNYDEIDEILNHINLPLRKNNKGEEYYDIPCSFDIETTSFKSSQLDKVSIMYEWTFVINWKVVIGRTWQEFEYLYNRLVNKLCTGIYMKRHLIIYVHNLSFEFQYLRKHFDWERVFSLKQRKPIQAITTDGIEFRCSYLLSGYSLARLAKQLVKYKIQKMVGDLDYSLIRHSKTPLTEKELGYCINDGIIVCAYIQELIDKYTIVNIPLTKTGFVRNYCRRMCLNGQEVGRNKYVNRRYRETMKLLTISPETYILCKEAFAGGFTHANPFYTDKVIENVASFDFTSSYPAIMCSEMFPMSRPFEVMPQSEEELQFYLDRFCCLMIVTFKDIKSVMLYDSYISVSHCRLQKKVVENNGRLVQAESVTMTITEQDYKIIEKFYSWEDVVFHKFEYFYRGYLPKAFLKSVLDLYVKKTTLKGVEHMEAEYLRSKEDVNSCYGMMVTDICREDVLYEEDWSSSKPSTDDAISKYNNSTKRFLYYPWGIWVTAYARANLFTGICEFGEDYIYADTDSIKVINVEKHKEYFDKYNETIINKLKKAMKDRGLDFELTRPKTIKGEVKQLGVWDYEGTYEKFKTLGAKRYMVKKKNALEVYNEETKTYDKYDYSFTVAGANKFKAIPYLLSIYGDNIFDAFTDELYIPPEFSGKMTHTYIDESHKGSLKDYLGNVGEYEELSGIHLENGSFDLKIASKYAEYFLGLQEQEGI